MGHEGSTLETPEQQLAAIARVKRDTFLTDLVSPLFNVLWCSCLRDTDSVL